MYNLSSGLLTHLVTDQIPLLLIVILSEEPGLVWGEVHRILKIPKCER